jgi:hypothetical protein
MVEQVLEQVDAVGVLLPDDVADGRRDVVGGVGELGPARH